MISTQNQSFLVNELFLGQGISDPSSICMMGGGLRNERAIAGLAVLEESRMWNHMDARVYEQVSSCSDRERYLSQPPSARPKNDILVSRDSGTGSHNLNSIPAFRSIDARMCQHHPHPDPINEPLQSATGQQVLPVPCLPDPVASSDYECPFGDHCMSLCAMTRGEGQLSNGYPNTHEDMRTRMDSMTTSFVQPSDHQGGIAALRIPLGSENTPCRLDIPLEGSDGNPLRNCKARQRSRYRPSLDFQRVPRSHGHLDYARFPFDSTEHDGGQW